MDLQTAALAVEEGGGAIFLQQRVSGSWGTVLLPEREADLWDQGLGPSQTGTCGALHWRWKIGRVHSYSSCIVLCFVFSLKNKDLSEFHFTGAGSRDALIHIFSSDP